MSETYNYEKGAIHNDHKKVIHIDNVGSNDIGKVIKAFFNDEAEEAEAEEGTGTKKIPIDEPLKNFIFNTSYFDTNAKLVKLRNTIAAAIDMGDDTCLYGEPQEKRINPSNKNEWYYIMKAIVESGVAKSNIADKDFVEQMVEWFPKLFSVEPQETMEAEKRKLAKSISGERSRWKKGNTNQEVALKDTMASGMVRTLGAKAQLMFEIAYKGLCLHLSELKHEMSNVKEFQ